MATLTLPQKPAKRQRPATPAPVPVRTIATPAPAPQNPVAALTIPAPTQRVPMGRRERIPFWAEMRATYKTRPIVPVPVEPIVIPVPVEPVAETVSTETVSNDPVLLPVLITSDPEEATVYVDDAQVGVTPFTIRVRQGDRVQIRVSKRGYKSFRGESAGDGPIVAVLTKT